ncbi:YggS family pyridoxal phosphate-dependent enzyme [Oricola sp.]|uniref:YggS family pyridoxal phosphate-dependent enzyme n=1 Tax=Oricola sp. TaxID=1979950 RepID=UPI0025D10DEB|nr:YggS family pyridoxal phosphate-dependent enzyme [Oricola sp.]MCI5077512.1 YggS family pyridoxal phosphate-dependent enzyme [Oricola sp.]
MSAVEGLKDVRSRIAAAAQEADRDPGDVELIAVSKTFDADAIRPVLEAGQRVFGENRVQEAQGKWPGLTTDFSGVELHLIGPLQSNKTKEAVALFDVIQTVDREKIARAIATEMEQQGKTVRLYVEINTGLEPQKAGIAPDDCADFLALCRDELGLSIEGLMCIPPFDENPGPHFALLRKLAAENGIDRLSMGMSGDFETAIGFGATSVRVGTAIFGAR